MTGTIPSDRRVLAGPPSVRPWNNPVYRQIGYQILLVAALGAGLWFLASNVIANLKKQNKSLGFDFLGQTAGFDISQTLIGYSNLSTYGRVFLVGLLNTLLVAVIGIILATLLGFLIGIARLSANWLVRQMATAYVEVLRNVPLLLQLFFWYFGILQTLPGTRQSLTIPGGGFLNVRGLQLPKPVAENGFSLVIMAVAAAVVATVVVRHWARRRQRATGQTFPVGWTGLGLILGLPVLAFLAAGRPLHFDYPELKGFNFEGGMVLLPEFMALLLGLVFYTAAYIAEVVRSGIVAVPKGQTEAARSLGLPTGEVLRLVVVPQAMRVMIPPLTNQYLNLTKNSSLGVAIGYPDLVSVFAGTVLNQTGQAVEVIFLTMMVYLAISLLTSAFMNWFNQRIKLVER
jgi:general L-amino acid transport system permease protein